MSHFCCETEYVLIVEYFRDNFFFLTENRDGFTKDGKMKRLVTFVSNDK